MPKSFKFIYTNSITFSFDNDKAINMTVYKARDRGFDVHRCKHNEGNDQPSCLSLINKGLGVAEFKFLSGKAPLCYPVQEKD